MDEIAQEFVDVQNEGDEVKQRVQRHSFLKVQTTSANKQAPRDCAPPNRATFCPRPPRRDATDATAP
jgi:hypothetical protein